MSRTKNCGSCRKAKSKCKCGRPSKLTEAVIQKLEQGFRNDFTVLESCIYAGIGHETFYGHLRKNKQFADRIESAQNFLFFAAKNNIAQSIGKNKSVADSWALLNKRQASRYAEKVNINNNLKVETKGMFKNLPLKELELLQGLIKKGLNDGETN